MRMEMARVALSLACSMSCSRAFGSVFATFRPDDRRRGPARSARTNSRCVCRRPSGGGYPSASSASVLHLRTDRDFFDLEGSDRMAQDVAHVGGVPIEAFDFVHPMLSIYDDRIYSQRGLLRR